jgi:hypothetical protein
MKQSDQMNSSPANAVLKQLAADKKKTVMALCLIGVMIFMWAKVFLQDKPKSAKGATDINKMLEQVEKSSPQLSAKISFVKLPIVEGRNEVLRRDFFDANNWRAFGEKRNSSGEVNFSSGQGDEEILKILSKRLKLEAIELGEKPLAFINNKLYGVGETFYISDGENKHECKVILINADAVFIKCGSTEITLKLTDKKKVKN